MSILDAIWLRFLASARRAREEERGDSMINWVVLAVGLSVVAAAIVALLSPALRQAAQHIISELSA
jgi:hypothetical protein